MSPLAVFTVIMVTLAALVFVSEQMEPPGNVDSLPAPFLAAGILVRLLLFGVLMVAVSYGMSTLLNAMLV